MFFLQVVPGEGPQTPPTTCFIDRLCQSTRRAAFSPGSYRLSMEPVASLTANTIGHRALAPFRSAISDPDSVGRGADGQTWLCLKDLELIYEGYFERLSGHVNRSLTPLHTFPHIVESLHPETRSIPSLPGVLTLSSPQRHTMYLWIGVHRWILYLADPVNAAVKKLLEDGVYAEKGFPKDQFPALTGEALYRDAESRDYRGTASNGRLAELNWSQVRLTKLSEAMELSEELVRMVETEELERKEEEGKVKNDADTEEDEEGKLLSADPLACLR